MNPPNLQNLPDPALLIILDNLSTVDIGILKLNKPIFKNYLKNRIQKEKIDKQELIDWLNNNDELCKSNALPK